jgi:hypothetical protein
VEHMHQKNCRLPLSCPIVSLKGLKPDGEHSCQVPLTEDNALKAVLRGEFREARWAQAAALAYLMIQALDRVDLIQREVRSGSLHPTYTAAHQITFKGSS